MSLDLSEALEHEEPGSPPAVQKSRHPVVAEQQLSMDARGGQTSPTHGPPDTVGQSDPQRAGTRWPLYLDQGLATVMGWKLINQQNAC